MNRSRGVIDAPADQEEARVGDTASSSGSLPDHIADLDDSAGLPYRQRSKLRFWLGLTAITSGAMALRVVYAVVWQWHFNLDQINDVIFYRWEALDIAEGQWYPDTYLRASSHPPLFGLVLSLSDLLRLNTYGEQMIYLALIGSLAVAVIGLVGRTIAGDRVGLLAAGIAAVFPGMWLAGSEVLSEPLAMLLVALAILAAYSMNRRPTLWRAAVLGVLCGLCALTRSELVLTVVLLAWPVVLFMKGTTRTRKVALAAVVLAAAVVVISPWAARNVILYREPDVLSTQGGVTLAWANCSDTYYGPLTGAWSGACITLPPLTGNPAVEDAQLARQGERYALGHLSRIPLVVFAREGRVWGFYQPTQEAYLNHANDGWNFTAARVEIYAGYVILLLGIAGVIGLRRRRVALSPLVGVVAIVALTLALFYGDPRFSASGDVALCILAAVGVNLLWQSRRWPLLRWSARRPSSARSRQVHRQPTAESPGQSRLEGSNR